MKVLLNTSTIFSHHLITSEHEDIIIINRIDNLDKCSNWDEDKDRDLLENSNIEELKVILSQLEFRDRVYQNYWFNLERRIFSVLKNYNKIII